RPDEATVNDEADIFVQPHVVAEGPHARLTLPDSHQGLAERRANDDAKNPESYEKSCERKIVERNRMSERPRQAEVRPGNCGNSVVPLGHCHPAVCETPDDH